MPIALALSFGEAGISNRVKPSVGRALYAGRRLRRAMWRGNRAKAPMFIHDPDKPAVLDPNGEALRRKLDEWRRERDAAR